MIHSPVPGSRHARTQAGWHYVGSMPQRITERGVKSGPHRAGSRVVAVAGTQRARTLRARGSTRPGRVTLGLGKIIRRQERRIRLRGGRGRVPNKRTRGQQPRPTGHVHSPWRRPSFPAAARSAAGSLHGGRNGNPPWLAALLLVCTVEDTRDIDIAVQDPVHGKINIPKPSKKVGMGRRK